MKRSICLIAASCCLLLACDEGGGQCETPGEQEEVAPIAVDCSFSFDGVQYDASVAPGASEEEAMTELEIGDLNVDLNLLDSEHAGRTFSLTIYKADSSVLSTGIYQMSRHQLPTNEFAGQHGFTGLNWVKDPAVQANLQYSCFARDPGQPPIAWDE